MFVLTSPFFDPSKTALWDAALPYSKIYVFPTIEHAQFALRTFGAFLSAPPADVGEVHFRVCAQCSSYQCQYPPGRRPALFGSSGPGAMPNFYSASLCRKNNISHLKKYSQRQATVATTSSFAASTTSASLLPPSAVGGRIVSRAPIPPFLANSNAGSDAFHGSAAAAITAAAAAAAAAAASASAMSWAVPHAAGIVAAPRREFRTTFVFQMLAQHRFAPFREYLKSFAEVCSFLPLCRHSHACPFQLNFFAPSTFSLHSWPPGRELRAVLHCASRAPAAGVAFHRNERRAFHLPIITRLCALDDHHAAASDRCVLLLVIVAIDRRHCRANRTRRV